MITYRLSAINKLFICLIFGVLFAMSIRADTKAAETVLTGDLYWGEDSSNGWSIIDHKSAYTVEAGDTLILDGVKAYGSLDGGANNGVRVKAGGKIIVRNSEFHATRAIHIVLDGGTAEIYSGFAVPDSYEFLAGKGKVYVYGGQWESNRHEYGGEGVFYMYPGSEFYMHGGVIGTITGTDVAAGSYTAQYGVYAYLADFTMTNGIIRNCLVGVLAKNVNISGGSVERCNKYSIASRGNSVSFEKGIGVSVMYGTGNFTGGRIDNNQFGIVNNATSTITSTRVLNNDIGVYHMDEFLYQKGTIEKNNDAGVYVQYNNYHVDSKAATLNSVTDTYSKCGIVLCDDYYITIDEEHKSKYGNIGTVYTLPQNRYLGRVIARTSYKQSQDATEHNKAFILLGFNGWEFRSGVGTNASYGDLILSGTSTLEYDKNYDKPGVAVMMKDAAGDLIAMNSGLLDGKGYWREPCQVTEEQPRAYSNGKEMAMLKFKCWNTREDGSGIDFKPGDYVPAELMDDTYTVYAIYESLPDVYYRGNGQTSGADYIKKYSMDEEYVLDENIFSKTGYSFQGWGQKNDLTYKDETVKKAGETFDLKEAAEWALEHGEYVTTDDGYAINIYAVWDEYPTINTTDYIVLDSDEDAITFDAILDNVRANDKEDNVLPKYTGPDQKYFYKIINYDDEDKLKMDVEKLNRGGAILIDVKARDGAGNEAFGSLWMYINSSRATNDQQAAYVRSINRNAYNTGDNAKGGCLNTSKWYRDSECVTSIETAFDNVEDGNSEETYYLSKEERALAIDWVLNNGFSNSKTSTAIKQWGRTLRRS